MTKADTWALSFAASADRSSSAACARAAADWASRSAASWACADSLAAEESSAALRDTACSSSRTPRSSATASARAVSALRTCSLCDVSCADNNTSVTSHKRPGLRHTPRPACAGTATSQRLAETAVRRTHAPLLTQTEPARQSRNEHESLAACIPLPSRHGSSSPQHFAAETQLSRVHTANASCGKT